MLEPEEVVASGPCDRGWLAFTTDDVDAVHERLVASGVQITQPPTDLGYGRDMGLRDPFGNTIRIGTMTV